MKTKYLGNAFVIILTEKEQEKKLYDNNYGQTKFCIRKKG